MNEHFRNWLAGIAVIVIFAVVLYGISVAVAPYNHMPFKDAWNISMTLLILLSGFLTYNGENAE